MIYLDAASTIKPKEEVVKEMMPYFEKQWFNPSSLYKPSVKIKQQIENARSMVGKFIGAKSNEIFFTSGGSESNCWAIQGFINESWANGRQPIIITSTIEHKSIIDCVEHSSSIFHFVGVDKSGFINIEALKNILIRIKEEQEEDVFDYDILVSIQYANNEIGTIQNIKRIAKLSHEYGAVFHTDAVQAFGNVSIDVKELNVDMLSASGHKIGAPKGIGFLYKKENVKIKPLIYGSQMDGMRGGTENVPYIIGMNKAVELLCLEQDVEKEISMKMNQTYFINRLRELGGIINGSLNSRLVNNINVTLPNITGEALVYALDMSNIYISTGSACNSYSIEPSYVLEAIGLTEEQAMRTVRFSLTNNIDEDAINIVINEIKKNIKIAIIE